MRDGGTRTIQPCDTLARVVAGGVVDDTLKQTGSFKLELVQVPVWLHLQEVASYSQVLAARS